MAARSSVINKRLPLLGLNGGILAAAVGVLAILLIPRSSRRTTVNRRATGQVEPVSHHSPFDIETPPAP